MGDCKKKGYLVRLRAIEHLVKPYDLDLVTSNCRDSHSRGFPNIWILEVQSHFSVNSRTIGIKIIKAKRKKQKKIF